MEEALLELATRSTYLLLGEVEGVVLLVGLLLADSVWQVVLQPPGDSEAEAAEVGHPSCETVVLEEVSPAVMLRWTWLLVEQGEVGEGLVLLNGLQAAAAEARELMMLAETGVGEEQEQMALWVQKAWLYLGVLEGVEVLQKQPDEKAEVVEEVPLELILLVLTEGEAAGVPQERLLLVVTVEEALELEEQKILVVVVPLLEGVELWRPAGGQVYQTAGALNMRRKESVGLSIVKGSTPSPSMYLRADAVGAFGTGGAEPVGFNFGMPPARIPPKPPAAAEAAAAAAAPDPGIGGAEPTGLPPPPPPDPPLLPAN